jgi:hypothetical protein
MKSRYQFENDSLPPLQLSHQFLTQLFNTFLIVIENVC